MGNSPTKLCTLCEQSKPLTEMSTTSRHGKSYYRSRCRKCDGARTSGWIKRNPEKDKNRTNVRRIRAQNERKLGLRQDYYILIDSRGWDRKHGFPNDLNREFIHGLIAGGCAYCGETDIRMTLDRINNDKGHTRDNVVPACIRCNYTRKDMPYEAWLVVAGGMREATNKHLFGTWTGRCR